MEEESGERLKAFCSITFDDCFVIRDLKIIEGSNGPFVAMPSRKLTAHCPQCGCKNHLRANHCNQCGTKLAPPRIAKDDDGRAKLYADIAHPINSACREMIQERVIRDYRLEQEAAKQEGYVSRYEDLDSGFAVAVNQNTDGQKTDGERVLEEGSTGHRQFQPPETEPRRPHRPIANQPSNHPRSGGPKSTGSGFGDGIFE
jgi:stage V sporulation protein G